MRIQSRQKRTLVHGIENAICGAFDSRKEADINERKK